MGARIVWIGLVVLSCIVATVVAQGKDSVPCAGVYRLEVFFGNNISHPQPCTNGTVLVPSINADELGFDCVDVTTPFGLVASYQFDEDDLDIFSAPGCDQDDRITLIHCGGSHCPGTLLNRYKLTSLNGTASPLKSQASASLSKETYLVLGILLALALMM